MTLLAAAEVHAASPSNAEAELALARKPALYVVVDPARGAVEIKIRGQAFVSLPLAGWAFLVYVPGPGSEHPELALPATLQVTGDPLSAIRRVATVESLRPYDDDDEDTPAPSPPPPPERAVTFEAPLESGWVLSVGPKLPPTRGLSGWAARLADGWATVRARPPARPPLLALALGADAASRLHHVLRPGTAILVLSPSAD